MLRALVLGLIAFGILFLIKPEPDLSNFRICSHQFDIQKAEEEIKLIRKAFLLLNKSKHGHELLSILSHSRWIYRIYFKSLDELGARYVEGTPSDMGDTTAWFGHDDYAFWYKPRPYLGDDNNYDPAQHEIWLEPAIMLEPAIIRDANPHDIESIAVLLAHELTHATQYLCGERWKSSIGLLEGDDVWDELWARLVQWRVEDEFSFTLKFSALGDSFVKAAWFNGDLALLGLLDYISGIYWEVPMEPVSILTYPVEQPEKENLALGALLNWSLIERINSLYEFYAEVDEQAYNEFNQKIVNLPREIK